MMEKRLLKGYSLMLGQNFVTSSVKINRQAEADKY